MATFSEASGVRGQAMWTITRLREQMVQRCLPRSWERTMVGRFVFEISKNRPQMRAMRMNIDRGEDSVIVTMDLLQNELLAKPRY